MTMELSVPQLEVAEETDETFGRIVAEPLEAGFGSYPHFHRIFKEQMGYGPEDYRRKMGDAATA